jgi:hypothetical protein
MCLRDYLLAFIKVSPSDPYVIRGTKSNLPKPRKIRVPRQPKTESIIKSSKSVLDLLLCDSGQAIV